MRAHCVWVAMAVAACVGEIPDRSGRGAKAIINGTQDPGDDNVVALVDIAGFFCTGTLVAPRVVVTAAHCVVEVQDLTKLKVYFGPRVGSGGREIRVVSGKAHPQASPDNVQDVDIAVLALAEPAPFAPKKMNSTPLDQSSVGKPLRLVGYGTDDPQANGGGVKRQTTTRVTSYTPAELQFGGTGTSACYGDSGGPAFMTVGGQELLVGVTSGGDENCTEGSYSRVDVHLASFVQPFIDANGGAGPATGTDPGPGTDPGMGTMPPSGGQCGAITYDGICEGNVLSYCDDETGTPMSYQCTTCNCESDGWCDCVEGAADPSAPPPGPGGTDECEGIDFFGACDGDVLLWCNEGHLEVVDCAQLDAWCDYESDDIGFNCL